MQLGVNLNYLLPGVSPQDQLAVVLEAERLGYDSVWAAEAYGSDAPSVLAWLAGQTSTIKLGSAICQIPARTPTMTAMTAATIDVLSGGRMVLGLLVQRFGFEAAAKEVQDLYLEGKKEAASAALPDELIDQVSLCGPRDVVRDRLAAYRDAGLGTLLITPMTFALEDRIALLRAVAELAAA
jgi:alkanesulfonate monooxygenase SsuD/methylene tetrahydromethanopterin reductase-like flavin-dependent oxidoreductase (luciferase family)